MCGWLIYFHHSSAEVVIEVAYKKRGPSIQFIGEESLGQHRLEVGLGKRRSIVEAWSTLGVVLLGNGVNGVFND